VTEDLVTHQRLGILSVIRDGAAAGDAVTSVALTLLWQEQMVCAKSG
jgi:hypothetical protein